MSASGVFFMNPSTPTPEDWLSWPAFSSTVICCSKASARRRTSTSAKGDDWARPTWAAPSNANVANAWTQDVLRVVIGFAWFLLGWGGLVDLIGSNSGLHRIFHLAAYAAAAGSGSSKLPP